MARRLALWGLIASTLCVVAAYASAFLPAGAGRISAFLMATGIAVMAVSLMTLGAVREGESPGALRWVFLFLFVVLFGGFAAALLLPDNDSAASRLFLGLPLRAAIVVYGVGFLPVFVLPVVYALRYEWTDVEKEADGSTSETGR